MRDNTHSGQKVLMKPHDLETVTSMMYNMSLQQGKTKKPFKPQVYQKRGRGQRQNYDRDRSRNNNRQGQNSGLNRHRNDYRRIGYTQNLAEMMAEIEVEEISTEATVVIGVGQEKEAYCPGGIIIKIIGRMATLDLDQGLEVDQSQE